VTDLQPGQKMATRNSIW